MHGEQGFSEINAHNKRFTRFGLQFNIIYIMRTNDVMAQ